MTRASDSKIVVAPPAALIDPLWKRVAPRVEEYARGLAGNANAEDVVIEAFLAIRTGHRPCEGNTDSDDAFVGFACGVVHSLWSTHTRAQKHEVTGVLEIEELPPAVSERSPESLAARHEQRDQFTEAWSHLRAQLHDDRIALAIVDLMDASIMETEEQAARLGVLVEDVYKAHMRIRYLLRHAVA